MDKTNFIEYTDHITDSNVLVVIDAGHGGIVNGEYDTAPNKMFDHGDFVFYEGVFNRQIAIKFAKKLKDNGISHAFTTNSNYDISLPVRVSRANNINRLHRGKYVYFVSIHGNAAGTRKANGVEAFTSPGVTDSDYIADAYLNDLNDLGWRMRYGRDEYLERDKESRFYVLVNTICPAILLELGFFTNKEQAKNMMKPDVQDKIVNLMYKSHLKVAETFTKK